MNRYIIKIVGCDDTTKVEMGLNKEELNVITKLAALSHENSEYGCMPTIKMEKDIVIWDIDAIDDEQDWCVYEKLTIDYWDKIAKEQGEVAKDE